MGLGSARVGCADPEVVEANDEDPALASAVGGPRERIILTVAERRQQLAKELLEQREDEVLDLHTTRSGHYVDNAFSLVTANMAVVSLVLGAVYMSRPCAKPLASFLLILGVLAPFAASLPILIRQWFYLHLRLRNVVTVGLLTTSALYVAWLLLGQRWAFACSSKNCDQDLSTATNAVVFVLYVMLLLYAAKVVWYLALRAPYSYKQLCLSCFQDPYPNALQLTDLELAHLERQHSADDADDAETVNDAAAKRYRVGGRAGTSSRKQKLLLDMQRHQRELRQSLHRLLPAMSPVAKRDRVSESEPRSAKHKRATAVHPTVPVANGGSRASSKRGSVVTV